MSDSELPVTVAVTRPDGGIEQVRVGTAYRRGEGFVVRMGELIIGGAPAAVSAVRGPTAVRASGGGEGGAIFPNYGRSKGGAIRGASLQDLEYYANGARRTLNDPGKARWHEKERGLLAAIEAEIARQQGGASDAREEPPPPGDGSYIPEE